MQVIDERIKEWATERQAQYINAVNEPGAVCRHTVTPEMLETA